MHSIEANHTEIEQVLEQLPEADLQEVATHFVNGWNRFEQAAVCADANEIGEVQDMLYQAGGHLQNAAEALAACRQETRLYMESSVAEAVGEVAAASDTQVEEPPCTMEATADGRTPEEWQQFYRDAYEALAEPTAADVALAQSILGEEFTYDPDAAYDDRRVILDELVQARETLRERMREILQSSSELAGMSVDEQAIMDWVPNEAERNVITHLARKAVRRYNKIQGVADFLADMEDEAAQSGAPLKDYQKVAVVDFYNFLVFEPPTAPDHGKGGIFEMPTGTGKTALEAKIAAMLVYGEAENDPENVLVLVPRQKILDQTMGRRGERGFGLFAPDMEVGEIWQDIHPLDREEQMRKKAVVMTFAQFIRLMAEGRMPHFSNVLVDEVHMASQGVTGDNLRAYGAGKIMVGLSATPSYDEVRSAYNLLPHQIHKMRLRMAIQFAYLAPTRGYLHDIEPVVDPSKLPSDRSARVAALKAAHYEARLLKIEEIVKDAVRRGVGVVVKCPPGDDVDYAVQIAGYLNDMVIPDASQPYGTRWVTARFVGGTSRRQTRKERDRVLEEYEKGGYDVVTAVKAVNVGWDTGHGKVFINWPTKSEVEEIQGMGRVLRLTRGIDGEPIWAEVHDFKDPFLGKQQYTCLDALGLEKSGDAVEHDPTAPPPIPRQRRARRRQRPVVENVIDRGVEVRTVSHMVELGPMSQEDLARITAQRKGGKVPFDEACRILGISPPTLHSILSNVGTPSHVDLAVDELTTILDLYPGLQAEPLPDDGTYVSALKVRDDMPRHMRSFTLLARARTHGIIPHRFTENGKVGFYFNREQVERLKELLAKD